MEEFRASLRFAATAGWFVFLLSVATVGTLVAKVGPPYDLWHFATPLALSLASALLFTWKLQDLSAEDQQGTTQGKQSEKTGPAQKQELASYKRSVVVAQSMFFAVIAISLAAFLNILLS